MTRKDQTDAVFSTIATMMTLSDKFSSGVGDLWENFKDSLGKYGKNYASPISFIIDVMSYVGITKEYIIESLVETLFDIPHATDLYYKIDNIEFDEKPEWIDNIEDAVKIVIADILTTILSCSVNPIIPDDLKDKDKGIVISRSYIDPNGMLAINPTTTKGHCYYNVRDYSKSSEYLDRNGLFMSMDLNAFIWYCNKIAWNNNSKLNTWDTRRESMEVNPNYRTSLDDWTTFINSDPDEGYTDSLMPIMQIKKGGDSLYSDYSTMTVIIDQHYTNIYQFNHDYLKNIELFNPKMILTSLLDTLKNKSMVMAVDTLMSFDIMHQYIVELVEKAIINAVERDDYTVSDCYYDFDNELWSKMLANAELQKYTGASASNNKDIIDGINEAYSSKSTGSTFNQLKSVVYEAIGQDRMSVSEDSRLVFNSNDQWLKELLLQLIMPFVNAILSPQVMLLFAINLEAMGLVQGFNDPRFGKVMSFIFGKIFSVIFGVIRIIKDFIVNWLIDLLKRWIIPLIIRVQAFLLLEKTRIWLEVLMAALACLPSFRKPIGTIDEVNYADIIPVQSIPETNVGKCDI